MKEKVFFRQGDVSLHPVSSLPTNVKQAENNILAYGEVTGHEHRLDSDEIVVYESSNGVKYVQLKQKTKLIHDFKGSSGVTSQVQAKKEDKHLVREIPAGAYQVRMERELDVFSDAIRQVAD